jgi:hypothetical protein
MKPPESLTPYRAAGVIGRDDISAAMLLVEMAGRDGGPEPGPLAWLGICLALRTVRDGHTCVDFDEIEAWAGEIDPEAADAPRRARMGAMFHNAAFLAAGVPVFDIRERFGATDMLVSDGDKGQALAQTLGPRHVALMRAHGSIAVGPSLETAVFRAVYTEVNARIQHWAQALAAGEPLAALDAQEGELADGVNQGAGLRAWELWRAQTRAQTGW